MIRRPTIFLGSVLLLTLLCAGTRAHADRVVFRFTGGNWSHSHRSGWHRYWGGPSIGFYYSSRPVYIVDGYDEERYYEGPDYWYSEPSFGLSLEFGDSGYRGGGYRDSYRDYDRYRVERDSSRYDRNDRGRDRGYSESRRNDSSSYRRGELRSDFGGRSNESSSGRYNGRQNSGGGADEGSVSPRQGRTNSGSGSGRYNGQSGYSSGTESSGPRRGGSRTDSSTGSPRGGSSTGSGARTNDTTTSPHTGSGGRTNDSAGSSGSTRGDGGSGYSGRRGRQ